MKNILLLASKNLAFLLRKNVKFIFILLFFLYPIPYTLYPTYAVDSTPSADIKAKLEELKKEIASKAAKLKEAVDRKLKDRAYVGKIKTISQNSVTLAASSGLKIVNISQDTVYESGIKGKKYSQKSMKEEDFIVALGDIDERYVLTAKKIILKSPKESRKTPLWGQVVAISDKIVTVKNREGKNIAVTLPSISAVKLNQFIILTGKIGKKEVFDSEFVYVIPQGGILKPKQLATPSAQIKPATPSGKKR